MRKLINTKVPLFILITHGVIRIFISILVHLIFNQIFSHTNTCKFWSLFWISLSVCKIYIFCRLYMCISSIRIYHFFQNEKFLFLHDLGQDHWILIISSELPYDLYIYFSTSPDIPLKLIPRGRRIQLYGAPKRTKIFLFFFNDQNFKLVLVR